jgi:hypothetical protein
MASIDGEGAARAPRVFVSYSHDSREHMDRVLALYDRLRREGIEAELDQYESVPSEGWPLWTARKVEGADFVLVVCTETYLRRFDGTEEAGKGLGVRWEGAAVVQSLYDAGTENDKFLPVLFDPADAAHIPLILRGTTRFLVSDEEGYEQLYRYLTAQPAVPRPVLGALRPLPPRPRATRFSPASGQPARRSRWKRIVLIAAGFVIALLSAWALFSALKPAVPRHDNPAILQRSVLRGEILDAQTGEPLAGVEVQLPEYDLERTTDKAGQYSFEVSVSGVASIKLRAMKTGYRLLNLDLPPGDHLNVHKMWRSP